MPPGSRHRGDAMVSGECQIIILCVPGDKPSAMNRCVRAHPEGDRYVPYEFVFLGESR